VRIALDATPLIQPSGGISRYTTELAQALASEFPEDEYWLASDQDVGNSPSAPNLRRAGRPRNWITRRWWLAGLPLELRRLRADIFHGTDFAVPYLRTVPSVMTFHDASPWLTGDRRAAGAGRIRRRAPFLLRLATMVITPTEAVRREAMERFGLAGARVAAVPLAAAEVFRPRPQAETAALLGRLGAAAPYLLFVGTREPRKNLGRLVEAWRQVRRVRPLLNLILAGRDSSDFGPAAGLSLPKESGLTVAQGLGDADIAALLSGAAVFVYPSLYEGFGLPVLEAMQAGAAVVISRDPALVEVAGGAAAAVDAESVSEMARVLVEVTGDDGRRLRLREQGFRRAGEFCWRRTAVRTREIYVEAMRRF